MKRKGFAVFVLLLLTIFIASSAFASDQTEAENLIDKATIVVSGFSADPDLKWFRDKVKEAKAVLIIPQSIQGAFFIGGSGGSGALLVHDAGSDTWQFHQRHMFSSMPAIDQLHCF